MCFYYQQITQRIDDHCQVENRYFFGGLAVSTIVI